MSATLQLPRLAELDLDTCFVCRGTEQNFPLDSALYQQALALFETIDHALGPADVLVSLGSRLIKAGFDGTDSVHQALKIYRQQDNLLGIYNALTDLSSWYLQQGQINESFNLRQEALEIAQRMGFLLAQATTYLGIGDYYFRTSDYANALAAYEQVEALTDLPGIRTMHGLALVNAYIHMNLLDRAESICHQTITLLLPIGNSPSLSLAYFILGNVLSAQGQWAEAISRWQTGLTVDVELKNHFDQAEKLKCIAQAMVMQHHKPGGSKVPDVAYETAMLHYSEAIVCLESIGDRQATAAIAGTYQLQGQTAVASGRSLNALPYLEQARETYAALELGMQTAITDSLLGLTCHNLGGRGYPELYAEASQCYKRALAYFQSTEMRDMTWKVCFYLADIDYLRGFQAATEAEQRSLWQSAAQWLETAAIEIDLVRGKFMSADAISQETARLGLVSNKEKVYTFAIKLHQTYLQDNTAAFNWLERLKGRVFLDGLALTSLRSPAIAEGDLLAQEQTILTSLQQATTQADVITLSQQLNLLWDRMATNLAAAEYVTLRRAEPICLKALLSCLYP
ncbi:tetratricopeptide repeat protein [Acaryochloris sp. CCMEE 5410]|uniref:tetratricopeptide repeat protein n=1 Tax=Acaryochloris sp. CCMEE 5410 TaxID=310037 RepID=UPI000306B302|nr:tetratricopeptide repeat protein [Acaryochloris sp. CCMEE 5410]KAI9130020.1 tetratricopeptide repeat protein [Acaryochloris sp. CCMEE 5410]